LILKVSYNVFKAACNVQVCLFNREEYLAHIHAVVFKKNVKTA